MEMLSRTTVLILAFVAMPYLWDMATGQDMTLLENHCQDHSHEPNSDAEKAIDKVYEFLLDHEGDPGYNTKTEVKIGYDTYYGQEACDGNISLDACIKCLGTAYEFTIKECTFSNGAQVKFGSCRFRVDNYPFDSNW